MNGKKIKGKPVNTINILCVAYIFLIKAYFHYVKAYCFPSLATEKAVNGETGRIQMDHVQNTDELRKEIEGLEKKNRALSARKATYIDLKRQLADLKTQKMQLEEELSILKQGLFIKKLNKLQPHSSSNSSTASLLSSLEIQQKETLLANVEMKISLFMKKNVNLHARIDWVRSKLGENVHNLTKMRALLDSL